LLVGGGLIGGASGCGRDMGETPFESHAAPTSSELLSREFLSRGSLVDVRRRSVTGVTRPCLFDVSGRALTAEGHESTLGT
jgi:hypothetical protein